ncbi:zinc finger domain-containing protein, LSD1 subclass [Bradyrhizobium erythrophlei]|uniref:Zinc finger domain-containing protein, LSD1 subclass n=1 Tax=Bradyrhizobium erythrophlei TaxID=1437360 RepID=A0A1M5KD36_9BRAD|nr:zinc finger domain-containing protein, LSD1 subclass [Bradyrhizobium erythrophlei]
MPLGFDVRNRQATPRVLLMYLIHTTPVKCSLCEDCGWVCESHPDKPWDGGHACTCGAAGAPCPRCNAGDDDPRIPKGFKTEFDKKGRRH